MSLKRVVSQLSYSYNTILFLTWKVQDGAQCALSLINAIQYYFEPVFDINNPFILKVFVVTIVLNILKKDCKLEPLGNLDGNIEDIVAAATSFMAKCYGSTVQGSMSDVGYDIWLKKTSKRKVTAKLKLQTLPSTVEAFKENVNREHLQAYIYFEIRFVL